MHCARSNDNGFLRKKNRTQRLALCPLSNPRSFSSVRSALAFSLLRRAAAERGSLENETVAAMACFAEAARMFA